MHQTNQMNFFSRIILFGLHFDCSNRSTYEDIMWHQESFFPNSLVKAVLKYEVVSIISGTGATTCTAVAVAQCNG
jgi:hypothetical protein